MCFIRMCPKSVFHMKVSTECVYMFHMKVSTECVYVPYKSVYWVYLCV